MKGASTPPVGSLVDNFPISQKIAAKAEEIEREIDCTPMGNRALPTDPTWLSTGLAVGLWTTLWLAVSWAWIRADRGPPDGDASGHVGAAELFLDLFARGEIGAALDLAWRGDTGEYPGLYPCLLGGLWALLGGGQPDGARALGLGLGLVTAAAVGWLGWRLSGGSRRALVVAWVATLLLPTANGLWRHAMPEGALIAAVAVSVAVAVWAADRPTVGRAAALGLALGLGLLTKQTYVLVGLAPILWAAWSLGWRWLVVAAVASAIAGPWYIAHIDAQFAYGGASVAAKVAVPWLAACAYYPLVLAWEGAGPVLALGCALAVWSLVRRGERLGLALPAVWLLAGLLTLVALPKKYPRLLAPVTPAAALLVGLALAQRRGRAVPVVGGALATGWLVLASTVPLPEPSLYERVDPGCAQRFLGPPLRDALGFGAVAAAVARAGAGPVVVLGGPEIPCEVRATHPWIEHLVPYLRREGLDRDVLDSARDDAALIVDWRAGPGEEVPVPSLGRSFWVRAPAP